MDRTICINIWNTIAPCYMEPIPTKTFSNQFGHLLKCFAVIVMCLRRCITYLLRVNMPLANTRYYIMYSDGDIISLGNVPWVKILWTAPGCWSTDFVRRRQRTWRPGGMVRCIRCEWRCRWSWTSIPLWWRRRENAVRRIARERYVPNCHSTGPRPKSSVRLWKKNEKPYRLDLVRTTLLENYKADRK